MLSFLWKETLKSHHGPKSTQLLGHASPTTTATYTHIANRGLHDAVARLAETPVAGSTVSSDVDSVFGNLQFYNPPSGKGWSRRGDERDQST